MKNLIKTVTVVATLTLISVFSGCASASRPGEPEYIREQVYQCRVLCTNGEVSITKIEGLDCVCNKLDKQSLIFSPIINNNLSGGSSPVSQYIPAAQSAPIVQVMQPSSTNLVPNGTGTTVQDATGRIITSQVKE